MKYNKVIKVVLILIIISIIVVFVVNKLKFNVDDYERKYTILNIDEEKIVVVPEQYDPKEADIYSPQTFDMAKSAKVYEYIVTEEDDDLQRIKIDEVITKDRKYPVGRFWLTGGEVTRIVLYIDKTK